MTSEAEKWTAFYEKVAARPPWPMLIRAAGSFSSPGSAADIGCGAGNDSAYLLEHGWHVLAIDRQPEAIEYLEARVLEGWRERLQTQVASFEEMVLPQVDLIWSWVSLSFCPQAAFAGVWSAILEALAPGGLIACDLWGPRHAWAGKHTTFSRAEVDALLASLTVESLDEVEEARPTAFDGVQHWHAFEIVARRA